MLTGRRCCLASGRERDPFAKLVNALLGFLPSILNPDDLTRVFYDALRDYSMPFLITFPLGKGKKIFGKKD
jgi:hypothetical protein